jgi:membrane protease YdiL (CAAX protease family)
MPTRFGGPRPAGLGMDDGSRMSGRRAHRRAESEAAIAALLVIQNVVVNRVAPRAAYVPTNLAMAGSLVAVARATGASSAALGMSARTLARGLRLGLLVSAATVAGIVLAAARPSTRTVFFDERAGEAGAKRLLYETLLRIPVGTALCEEVMFRGVLLGALLQHHSRRQAIALSSIAFGLAHVLPTLDTLPGNAAGARLARARLGAPGTIVGAVAAMTIAGWALARLRLAGGLGAPVVVHASANSASYVAARMVL